MQYIIMCTNFAMHGHLSPHINITLDPQIIGDLLQCSGHIKTLPVYLPVKRFSGWQ